MINKKPYDNALIFAGGGLRFGYYLGIYQAYYEHYQKPPELIIASCGGAIALSILSLCPNPMKAQDFFKSYACYQMLCRIKSRTSHSLKTYAIPALSRYLKHKTPFINHQTLLSEKYYQSLYHQALFCIDDENNKPLFYADDFLKECGQYNNCNDFNSIIIFSQLNKTHNGYQWQECLSCSNKNIKNHLLNQNISSPLYAYNSVRVQQELNIMDNLPIEMAMRASMADMYYLTPILYQDNILFGGVLDLMPIEIANKISNTIFIDDKPTYDNYLAIPAIDNIFGFNANQRLQDLKQNTNSNIHWLPLADNRTQIDALLKKQYRLKQGGIQPIYPTFDEFKQRMQTQIDYGYRRSLTYFKTME